MQEFDQLRNHQLLKLDSTELLIKKGRKEKLHRKIELFCFKTGNWNY